MKKGQFTKLGSKLIKALGIQRSNISWSEDTDTRIEANIMVNVIAIQGGPITSIIKLNPIFCQYVFS